MHLISILICLLTDDEDEEYELNWQQTEIEREHNWYNVSGLLHGRIYRLRVAAVDRHGDMMKSDYVEVVIGIHPGMVLIGACERSRSGRISTRRSNLFL